MSDKARRKERNQLWVLREREHLCQCPRGDDLRFCLTTAELEAAKQRPPLMCADCGRLRMIVQASAPFMGDGLTAAEIEVVRAEAVKTYYQRRAQ